MAEPDFAALFRQSTDIHTAIQAVVTRSLNDGGVIDPVAVVGELVTHYPDLALAPADLLDEVVRAATTAGLSLSIGSGLPPP